MVSTADPETLGSVAVAPRRPASRGVGGGGTLRLAGFDAQGALTAPRARSPCPASRATPARGWPSAPTAASAWSTAPSVEGQPTEVRCVAVDAAGGGRAPARKVGTAAAAYADPGATIAAAPTATPCSGAAPRHGRPDRVRAGRSAGRRGGRPPPCLGAPPRRDGRRHRRLRSHHHRAAAGRGRLPGGLDRGAREPEFMSPPGRSSGWPGCRRRGGGGPGPALRAPAADIDEVEPSLVRFGDAVAVLWGRGSHIYICGGCIPDHRIDCAGRPAHPRSPSNVVSVERRRPQAGGLLRREVAALGPSLLTTFKLTFHVHATPGSATFACNRSLNVPPCAGGGRCSIGGVTAPKRIARSTRSGGSRSPRLIAGLARIVRDVGLAEELAQDALVTALERWPETGVPDNPGAWLMATAKHRAIDQFRRTSWSSGSTTSWATSRHRAGRHGRAAGGGHRRRRRRRPAAAGVHLLPSGAVARGPGGADPAPAGRPDHRGDCPRLPGPRAHGGPADRARQADAGRGARSPSRCPAGPELAARLASVLEVIYLVFNEGYSATAGEDWMRPGPVRGRPAPGAHPGRAVARRAGGARPGGAHGDPGLAPAARTGPAGEPILLLDQNRGRWDQVLIRRGLAALERAEKLAGPPAPTPCRRPSPPATPAPGPPTRPTGCASRRCTRSWPGQPSAVVELNRAVAVAMAFGPAAGLEIVDRLRASRRCAATTCCRACAAISWPSWAASTRRGSSSSARPP